MAPSPSEATNLSATQEFAKFFREHEIPLPHSQELSNFLILRHINPVHANLSYLSKIHSNIILPPTSISS
jgi:hypothetical protein